MKKTAGFSFVGVIAHRVEATQVRFSMHGWHLIIGPIAAVAVPALAASLTYWAIEIVIWVVANIFQKQVNLVAVYAARPWIALAVAIWAGIAFLRSVFPAWSDVAEYLKEVPLHLGNLFKSLFKIAVLVGGGYLLFRFLGATFLK